ncbi:hypothetical protein BJ742DRAFT_768797 [Cladochytrium replicatum]|nr:hypothetical protein BJ742DRAFT_768797 [Cladochytrium replicatum]
MFGSTLTRRSSSHAQYPFTSPSGPSTNGVGLTDPYSNANGHSYSGQSSPQQEKDRYLQPFLLHSLGATDSSSSTIPIPSKGGVSTPDYTGSPRGLRRTASSGSSPVWPHARTRSRSPGGLGSPRLYGSPDDYGTEYGSSVPRDSRHLGEELPPTQRLEELNMPVLSFGTPAIGNSGSSNGWSRGNNIPPTSSTSRRSLFWDSNSPTELTTTFPPTRPLSSVSQPNCAVTVIGIMPHVSTSIASHFRSLGEVVSLQLPPSGNWMNVVYANEAGARRALGEHRRIFDDCMISVEINTSHNSSVNGSTGSTSSLNNKPVLNGRRESTDGGTSPSPFANGGTRSVLKRPRSFLDTSTVDSSSSPLRRKVQQNGDTVESVGVMRTSSALERNGSISQSSGAPRKRQVVKGGVKSSGGSGLWESFSSFFTNW